jgi:hypothetical protein
MLLALVNFSVSADNADGPDRTRTCDLRFRKPLLYPAELRDQGGACIAPSAGPRTSTQPSLLRGDVVGADHVAPQLDLALEQSLRGFGTLFVLWV